jgi:cell division protein FtsN
VNFPEESILTKDYAKHRKTKQKKMPAGWVWLFMGTFLGGFISLLFFLGKMYPKAPHAQPEIASETHTEKQAPANAPTEKVKPKFTFYTDLAELKSMAEEIDAFFPENHSTKQKPMIPFTAPIDPETLEKAAAEKAAAEKAAQIKMKKDRLNDLELSEETYINQTPTAKKTPQKEEAAPIVEKKPAISAAQPSQIQSAKIGSPTRHSLQAGSFRASKEADRRRAELLMLGFSAQIQTVSLANGETYHRVVIFLDNDKQLKQAEEKLNKHNIATKAQSIH